MARPFTPPAQIPEGTALRAEVEPDQLRSGTVVLSPGAGTWVSPTDDGFRFDAASDVPPVQLNHFRPGSLAAGTIRTWGQARALQGQIAAFIEAWLDTPPSDVSAGHYILRLTGSDGGSFDLALNVNGQQRYTAELDATEALNDLNFGSNINQYHRSVGRLFIPRGGTVGVTAISYRFSAATADDTRRLGILDLDGNWLSYANLSGSVVGVETVRLPRLIELDEDTPYIVAMEGAVGDSPASSVGRTDPLDLAASLDIQAVDLLDAEAGFAEIVAGLDHDKSVNNINGVGVRYDAPAGVGIADAIKSGVNLTPPKSGSSPSIWTTQPTSGWEGFWEMTVYAGWGSTSNVAGFQLHGTQQTFNIGGAFTVEAVESGAPGAPGTPADVSIRLEATA